MRARRRLQLRRRGRRRAAGAAEERTQRRQGAGTRSWLTAWRAGAPSGRVRRTRGTAASWATQRTP
eukprot:6928846-Pyramimonas_sp.AAC.1